MEKRLLVSLALALLVLWVFNRFFIPPVPPEEELAGAPPSQVASSPPDSPAEALQEATGPGNVEPETGEAASTVENLEAEQVEEVLIQTAVYAVRLSNEGARLESLRFRNYAGAEGETLELIGQESAKDLGHPLAITTGDPVIDEAIRLARYVVAKDQTSVRFEMASNGIHVIKAFRFDSERYDFQVEAEVRQDGVPVPFELTWQGVFGDQSIEFDPGRVNVVRMEGTGFKRFTASSIGQVGWFSRIRGSSETPEAALLPTTYVGIEDQYFLAMFLLQEPEVPDVSADLLTPSDPESRAAVQQTPRLSVGYPNTPISLYVGPKHPDTLAEVDPALASVINYGVFGFFSGFFLRGLMWIHDHVVANYGWSIILLTILVNLVFFPLRLKQQLSMFKMQKLGPQMRSLQDKMKKLKGNDPRKQELQAEMMGLYKKHGVNPLGGCLPLLLQMPFLYAMFSLLRNSIELRQAPWALWIHDLSRPDPLVVVLPGLMGLSMFAMQKMTPSAVDPSQARMMLIMPVLLPLMLLRMQSGLMLYWLTSNLVGIGQQYLIRKRWAPDSVLQSKRPSSPKAELADAPGSDLDGSADGLIEGSEPEGGSGQEPKKRRQRRRKK